MRAAGWCVRRTRLPAASVADAGPSAQEGSPGSSVTSASSALAGSLVQSMVRLMPLARGIGAVSSCVNERSVRATELITGVGGKLDGRYVCVDHHPPTHDAACARLDTWPRLHGARDAHHSRTSSCAELCCVSPQCVFMHSPDSIDRRVLTNQCTCGVAACLTRSCVCVCVCFSSETSSWTSVCATRSFLFTACSLGPSWLFL